MGLTEISSNFKGYKLKVYDIFCSSFGTKDSRMDQVKFFKGCLPQILFGPFWYFVLFATGQTWPRTLCSFPYTQNIFCAHAALYNTLQYIIDKDLLKLEVSAVNLKFSTLRFSNVKLTLQ